MKPSKADAKALMRETITKKIKGCKEKIQTQRERKEMNERERNLTRERKKRSKREKKQQKRKDREKPRKRNVRERHRREERMRKKCALWNKKPVKKHSTFHVVLLYIFQSCEHQ